MQILLIDNHTTLLKKLEQLIPEHCIEHVCEDLKNIDGNAFDLVILSGGSKFEIVGNENNLRDEMRIIRETMKPIIGICYGCEVIATAFGGTLEKGPSHKGILDIDIVYPDEIFQSRRHLRVYENHRWLMKALPKNFIPLAQSPHGYEAIKHHERLIYGFQFHPEQFIEQTDGDEIFLNLFRKISAL